MVKRNQGYTLVEVMIVVAILGIVFAIIPPLIQQTGNFFLLGRTKLELQREARAATYLITRELRQAQSSTIVIDQVSGQPYYSRVSFTKVRGEAVTIYQNGDTLNFTEGNNTLLLSKNLSYLTFVFPNSNDMTIMTVSLTLEKEIYLGKSKALHMASEQVRIMD